MLRTAFSLLIALIILTACSPTSQTVSPTAVLPSATAELTPTSPVVPASPTTPAPATPTATVQSVEAPTETLAEPTAEPSATSAAPPVGAIRQGAPIYVDHNSLALFDQIPDEFIQAASQLSWMHRGASIAFNISFGLDCLMDNRAVFPDQSKRFFACDKDVLPAEIAYDPKYDRTLWQMQTRGNPGWIAKVEDFIAQVEAQGGDFEVVSFSLDYVDGLDNQNYPVVSSAERFASYIADLEALEARYPDKIFVWWTMSLARQGQANTTQFNILLREYLLAHNKIVIDIADIESHGLDGQLVLDEQGNPIIFEGYTDEAVSGHLNAPAHTRMAKALWILMAQIAGWQPEE